MNNKGQTLVVFVLLLPFLFLVFAYLFDKCYITYQQRNQNEIGKILCKQIEKTENIESIQELAYENDRKLEKIEYHPTKREIILEKRISSIFGRTIKQEYLVKTITKCKN